MRQGRAALQSGCDQPGHKLENREVEKIIRVGNLVLQIAIFPTALEERVCQVLFTPTVVGKEFQATAKVSADQETGQSSSQLCAERPPLPGRVRAVSCLRTSQLTLWT